MQQTVIIYLFTQDVFTQEITRPSWAVLSEDWIVKEIIHQGDPLKLAAAVEGNEVIVIVPAEAVLLTHAKLPKMDRTKLLQALPYALEDQLIEDVSQLHFALGKKGTEGEISCAIIAKEKLQFWLNQLQTWHVEAEVLLPLTLALPLVDHQWNVLVIDQIATVRTGLYSGFACDVENLDQILKLSLSPLDPELLPQRIRFDYCGDQEVVLDGLPSSIAIEQNKKSIEQCYAELADNIAMRPAINLLQAEYKSKKSKLPRMQKVWSFATHLALTWAILLVLAPTVSYFMLVHREGQLENQIAQIYHLHFPQSSNIVAPKLRMEEKLQQIRVKNSGDKFLVSIGYLGKAKLEIPSILLKRLDFQHGELSLDVTSSSDDLSKFITFLTRQGMKVRQQNTIVAGTGLQATLVIE